MKDIRPYRDEYLDGVVSLSLRAWAPVFESIRSTLDAELYEFFYSPDWQTSQSQAVQDVCAANDISVWVRVDGESVTGFVALKLDSDSKTGEIYMIAVDPDYQRRGIASQLTNFALDKMREAGMTLATVNTGADPGHAPARLCYEKSGFSVWPSAAYFKKLS